MIRECISAEQALAFAKAWDLQAEARKKEGAHWSVVQFAQQSARIYYKRAELMLSYRHEERICPDGICTGEQHRCKGCRPKAVQPSTPPPIPSVSELKEV